jgi:hypothetical protein
MTKRVTRAKIVKDLSEPTRLTDIDGLDRLHVIAEDFLLAFVKIQTTRDDYETPPEELVRDIAGLLPTDKVVIVSDDDHLDECDDCNGTGVVHKKCCRGFDCCCNGHDWVEDCHRCDGDGLVDLWKGE